MEILVYGLNCVTLLKIKMEFLGLYYTSAINIIYLVANKIIKVIKRIKIFLNYRIIKIKSRSSKFAI